ncbi:MAG: DUF6270 domain-containing protein [Conexibacter sp.]
MSAPTVAIFGSCVTRDLFEDPGLRPALGPYLARSSVISVVSRPVAIDPERVEIASAWQRRCLLADFQKTFFATLAEARSEWLVVDLIDERFDILRGTPEGAFVTRSSAFQAAGLDEADQLGLVPVRRMSSLGCELFDLAARDFAARVSAIIPPERVVLHRALWCTRYVRDGEVREFPPERLELCRRQNAMLVRGYDALERAFGGRAVTIELDPERELADAGHRWELEPFHYAATYNEDTAGRLRRMLGVA